jgi:phage repressor protein C with HTH and peptisase S24 domain
MEETINNYDTVAVKPEVKRNLGDLGEDSG